MLRGMKRGGGGGGEVRGGEERRRRERVAIRAVAHLDLGLREPPSEDRELVRPAAGVGALQQAPIRIRDLEASHSGSHEVGHNDCGRQGEQQHHGRSTPDDDGINGAVALGSLTRAND